MNQVSKKLNVENIECNLLARSIQVLDKSRIGRNKDHNGDIILKMQNPKWNDWTSRVNEVVTSLEDEMEGNGVFPVKQPFPGLVISYCTSQRLKSFNNFVSRLNDHEKLNYTDTTCSEVGVPSVKVLQIIPKLERDAWSTRLQIVSDVAVKCYRSSFKSVEYEEFHEGLIGCVTHDADARMRQLRQHPDLAVQRGCYNHELMIIPDRVWDKIGAVLQCESKTVRNIPFPTNIDRPNLKLANSLVKVIHKKTGKLNNLVIFLKEDRLVLYQQSLIIALILSLEEGRSIPNKIVLIPVGKVTMKEYSKIEEAEDYIKSMIATKAVDDDSLIGLGDVMNGLSMPSLDEGRVKCLFDCCMKCLMLSTEVSSPMMLDMASVRSYIFIQYNMARLNNIFDDYAKNYRKLSTLDDSSTASLIVGEAEWKLLFPHVFSFIDIFEEAIKIKPDKDIMSPATPKLVNFMVRLSKELSVYYRTTRVLLNPNQEHTLPLVHSRITILKVVYNALNQCLKSIDVDAVSKM